MEDTELLELLRTLSDLASSPTWSVRHGSVLAFSSMFLNCASKICQSTVFSSITDHLKDALKDDKVLYTVLLCWLVFSIFLCQYVGITDEFFILVPHSWNCNQGLGKASSLSSSKWIFKCTLPVRTSSFSSISSAGWLQRSQKKSFVQSESCCKGAYFSFHLSFLNL